MYIYFQKFYFNYELCRNIKLFRNGIQRTVNVT